jgi:hypothetical protein
VRDVLAGHGDVRYVWRHLPLTDVHPHAQLAAEAAEAAGDQGASACGRSHPLWPQLGGTRFAVQPALLPGRRSMPASPAPPRGPPRDGG